MSLEYGKHYAASTRDLWDGAGDDPFAKGAVVYAEDRVKGFFFGLLPSSIPGKSSVRCEVAQRDRDLCRVVFRRADAVPDDWWTHHDPGCGTMHRGCAPDCPKDVYEKTGRWIR